MAWTLSSISVDRESCRPAPPYMRDALIDIGLGVLKSEMRNICSVFLLLVEMGTTGHFRP
jgi:hypothetical protein